MKRTLKTAIIGICLSISLFICSCSILESDRFDGVAMAKQMKLSKCLVFVNKNGDIDTAAFFYDSQGETYGIYHPTKGTFLLNYPKNTSFTASELARVVDVRSTDARFEPVSNFSYSSSTTLPNSCYWVAMKSRQPNEKIVTGIDQNGVNHAFLEDEFGNRRDPFQIIYDSREFARQHP